MKRPADSAIEALADRYALFLFDQFGVLHDGERAYPGRRETLVALRAAGARVGVLTNSGKRAARNRERLAGFGFDGDAIDFVVSSGEVAWRELSAPPGGEDRADGRDGDRGGDRGGTGGKSGDEGADLGVEGVGSVPTLADLAKAAGRADGRARVLVLSRGDDRDFVGALALVETDDAADCDLVLIAGCEPEAHALDDYRERLRPAARRGVPALCTNPDREMLLGSGRTAFAPGQVAEAYAALGGAVSWIGKPYPAIYAHALALGGATPAATLCIGDSVEHDIAGASAAGCDSLLVLTGIHEGASSAELDALFEREGHVPTWIERA